MADHAMTINLIGVLCLFIMGGAKLMIREDKHLKLINNRLNLAHCLLFQAKLRKPKGYTIRRKDLAKIASK